MPVDCNELSVVELLEFAFPVARCISRPLPRGIFKNTIPPSLGFADSSVVQIPDQNARQGLGMERTGSASRFPDLPLMTCSIFNIQPQKTPSPATPSSSVAIFKVPRLNCQRLQTHLLSFFAVPSGICVSEEDYIYVKQGEKYLFL